MPTDNWPQPPFHPNDYPALRELLGQEEFERLVCGADDASKQGLNYPTRYALKPYPQSESHRPRDYREHDHAEEDPGSRDF